VVCFHQHSDSSRQALDHIIPNGWTVPAAVTPVAGPAPTSLSVAAPIAAFAADAAAAAGLGLLRGSAPASISCALSAIAAPDVSAPAREVPAIFSASDPVAPDTFTAAAAKDGSLLRLANGINESEENGNSEEDEFGVATIVGAPVSAATATPWVIAYGAAATGTFLTTAETDDPVGPATGSHQPADDNGSEEHWNMQAADSSLPAARPLAARRPADSTPVSTEEQHTHITGAATFQSVATRGTKRRLEDRDREEDYVLSR
jgi:hypothetical protein